MRTRELTSADGEPSIGEIVVDATGVAWEHLAANYGGTYWLRVDGIGEPESWHKVAGNYGPVRVRDQADTDARDHWINRLASAMYTAWQSNNPYQFEDQQDDIRAEYLRAAEVVFDREMSSLLVEVEGLRLAARMTSRGVGAPARDHLL